jgi:membrane carboxypeptidase/penicillin-binding protein
MGGIPTFVNSKNGIALDSTIAVGSYVGFDDNRPLKSGRTRIAGASGALPQWAQFTKEVLDIRKESKKIDFLDITLLASKRVPLLFINERGMLPVNSETGLADGSQTAKVVEVPWLDVPGYIPPVVTTKAAEEAAEQGIVVSISMPLDSLTNKDSTKTTDTITTSQPIVSSDDWELPADFSGKDAFVPIEPEIDSP